MPTAPVWAVPSFLAISGFYVLRSYEQSGSWKEFIKRRALRILPALIIALILVSPFGLAPVWGTIKIYVTCGLAAPTPHNDAPAWSLGVEEIAYLAMAVLYTIGAYRSRWPIWLALVISCAISAAIGSRHEASQAITIAVLPPSFFAGSLVYVYRESLPKHLWLCLPACFLLFPLHNMLPSWWWFAQGLLMGVGMLGLRALAVPRIPDFSYGCYIYHWPILGLMARVPISYFFPVLIIFCAASWYLVEKPALRLKTTGRNPNEPEPAQLPEPNPAQAA